MPTPTPALPRWHIKAALLSFLAAAFAAVALAAPWTAPLPVWAAAVSPMYFHLFMVGWVTQLSFGVAYWLFPRHTKEQPRGSQPPAIAAFGALNAGPLLRAVGEPLNAAQPGAIGAAMLLASAAAQWAAGVTFVANTWGRVKER
ncbi:MAG: hypothetical protein NTZ05_15815 [Chloroflexi bacterium]|nr:hypothetical protein [Chloroflexota bacterium]